MKTTKQKFNRIMRTIGACSFAFFFGFGHFIACNEKIDYTPVITVPVHRISNLISPTGINAMDNLQLVYTFSDSYTLNSRVYNVRVQLNLYVANNVFYSQNEYYFVDMNTNTNVSASQLYEIGNLTSFDEDIELIVEYGTTLPMVSDDTYPFFINTTFVLNRSTTTIRYNYYYSSSNVYIVEPTTLIDDYIDSVFAQEFFFDLNNYYLTSYNNGVNYVLTHLSEYGLYTNEQYLAYGQSQYDLGRYNSSQVLNVSDMIREIFRAPISMFTNAFNFVLPLPDGTTLNVGGILTFFLTIGIALTIVALISKIGGH